MAENRLTIQLNANVHSLRSGKLFFRPNARMGTLARHGTANEIKIKSNGEGTISLDSIGNSPYTISISIRNEESSLLIANIRVNAADREVCFNDNWTLDHSGLTNYRLNQQTKRIPLTTSNVLNIECNFDAFDRVGDENFIIVESSCGYQNVPVVLHLTKTELLDVFWYNNNASISAVAEYYHDVYYHLYNDARKAGLV